MKVEFLTLVADLELAVSLARTALSGPEDVKPDALFDLIGLMCVIPANDLADVSEAVQDAIYHLTPHRKEGFQARRRMRA